MSGDPAGGAPRQQTIGNSFALEGTGLHSGQPANAEVRPADADTGIVDAVLANLGSAPGGLDPGLAPKDDVSRRIRLASKTSPAKAIAVHVRR